jgi:serine/threonine protein kinase
VCAPTAQKAVLPALLVPRKMEVSLDSLEGQNLGKYRVLEALGRGGMARVYRAYHPQLDRYVAIKVLRSDLVEEEEFLARFKREARAVAALRHPNIVQVYDFDVRSGLYFMVMELLEGDTLRRRLNDYQAQGEKMPLGEVVRILLDVLEGLAYAHSEDMIHRDVKPANILLTRRGQAVLTDFGIAQIIGGTRYTVSGALMGTLSYMAPEQGLEGQCDARSDIYSLGIVFYEMLTGEPPFDAETPLAILLKHVNDPLPLPRKMVPSIPKWLERVVLKSLAKRPADRYQSAEEMSAALHKAAAKARVDLPDRISLPLSFTTREAPSESVAVLSGTARDRVQQADFADEDTDATLGERLAAEAAAVAAVSGAMEAAKPASAKADSSFVKKVALAEGVQEADPPRQQEEYVSSADEAFASAREAIVSAGSALERAADAWVDNRDIPDSDVPVQRGAVGRSIVYALAIVALVNIGVVFFSLITQWWGTFGRGWPFELLVVGLGLCIIMEASAWPWLMLPTGIILGNGFLMAFYAVTNWWGLWAWLWPLEPMLVFGTIVFTVWLAGQGNRGRHIARHLGRTLRRPAIVAIPVVVVLGAIFG